MTMDWPLIVILWSHIVAATVWIGGMLFLSLVLAPVMRTDTSHPAPQALFRSIARRYRVIVWGAIGVLLVTGILLLNQHGMFSRGWEKVPCSLILKLFLVAVLIGCSGLHDFVMGPRSGVIRKKPQDTWTPAEKWMALFSPWIARLSVFVSLGVLAVAAVLKEEL